MGGINIVILRRDFEIARTKINSADTHAHYGNGSYLNIENAIVKNTMLEPMLMFQEGIAPPKGATDVEKHILHDTWLLPTMRGMHNKPHHRPSFGFLKEIINRKTLPWLIIGLAVLASLLKGGGVI